MAGAHALAGNELNYGNPDNTPFDGIHMYGRMGCEAYTKSITNTLSNLMSIQHVPQDIHPRMAANRKQASTPAPKGFTQASPPSATGPSPCPPSSTRTPSSSVFQYAVKTFNRFSTFLQ